MPAFNYSISSLLFLIIVTVVLILLFSFVKTYLPLFFRNKSKYNNKLKRWFYVIEISTIIIVLLGFISYSYSRNIIIASVLVLILMLILYFLSQYFIKDYIVGLLIKSTGQYRINDQISIDQINGRVTRLGKTQIRITDTDGNTIYLPYNLLITKVKTVQQAREKVNGHSFELHLPKSENYNRDIEQLKEHIRFLPWILPTHEAIIELQQEEADSYQLLITVFSFDKKYYQSIEKSVIKFQEKNQPKQ